MRVPLRITCKMTVLSSMHVYCVVMLSNMWLGLAFAFEDWNVSFMRICVTLRQVLC